ncbi:hypothetical protein pb186bvf_007950 [Paramecium bursaria]
MSQRTDEKRSIHQAKCKINKQKTVMFQKYMIIRLNDILLRKQIRNAFNLIREIQPKEYLQVTTKTTAQKNETKHYTVELEIIRPKLRGEVLFSKAFNISDLKISKKDNKLCITKPSDSIAQFNTENNERESKTKIQDLKQLMKLQKSMKDISINQKHAKPRKNQIGIYQILILVFVLYFFILIL